MFKKVRNLVVAGAAAATAAMANTTTPDWWPTTELANNAGFDGVIFGAAPIAVGVVVAVAGVRVLIKLINRGAGK